MLRLEGHQQRFHAKLNSKHKMSNTDRAHLPKAVRLGKKAVPPKAKSPPLFVGSSSSVDPGQEESDQECTEGEWEGGEAKQKEKGYDEEERSPAYGNKQSIAGERSHFMRLFQERFRAPAQQTPC